jgi:DNA-binding response OmpR family regulator
MEEMRIQGMTGTVSGQSTCRAQAGSKCVREAGRPYRDGYPRQRRLVRGGLHEGCAERLQRCGGREALPAIVMSSGGSAFAGLRAFREGCDDYLRKPVSYPVLLARVGAIVRRSVGRPVPRRRIGALEIDPLQRRVAVAERPVHLSRMEFELLSHLAVDPTRVYTKKQLLREVWGYRAMGNTRTVDAHACRLRTKLVLAGAPNLVANVRGVGYRLCGGPRVSDPDEPVAVPLSSNRRAA